MNIELRAMQAAEPTASDSEGNMDDFLPRNRAIAKACTEGKREMKSEGISTKSARYQSHPARFYGRESNKTLVTQARFPPICVTYQSVWIRRPPDISEAR
jgi:hypothetical protein